MSFVNFLQNIFTVFIKQRKKTTFHAMIKDKGNYFKTYLLWHFNITNFLFLSGLLTAPRPAYIYLPASINVCVSRTGNCLQCQ